MKSLFGRNFLDEIDTFIKIIDAMGKASDAYHRLYGAIAFYNGDFYAKDRPEYAGKNPGDVLERALSEYLTAKRKFTAFKRKAGPEREFFDSNLRYLEEEETVNRQGLPQRYSRRLKNLGAGVIEKHDREIQEILAGLNAMA